MKAFLLPGLFLIVCSSSLSGAGRQLAGQHAPATTPALTPDEAQKRFKVPEGFEVRLFASEPQVINPVAMTWDDRGRLWVVELYEYPLGAPKGTKPRDNIKILEDTDLDGKADKVTVFADGLNLATGILLSKNGAYVGQAPHLLFLPDANGDDKSDIQWSEENPYQKAIVLTGFGLHDRHELLNGFTWGPDGQIYMTHGVFTHSKVKNPEDPNDDGVIMDAAVARYHPATKKFEVYADGTSNPWGVDYDRAGNMFVSACVIDHLFQMAPAGLYARQGGKPPNPFGYELLPSIVDHKHFRAAYGGIQVYQGHQYPKEYLGTIFMGNIHASAVHQDRLTPVGSTFKASAESDFLIANDGWFRPVSMQTGPDGALWIMDWYDRYPCYQNANADPEGVDREHGRIWRIVHHAGKPGGAVPPHEKGLHLSKLKTGDLVTLLGHSNSWHRRMAQRLLNQRRDPAARKLLETSLARETSIEGRVAALWTLHGSEQLQESILDQYAADKDPIIRTWVARFTGERRKTSEKRLLKLAADPDPTVRLGVATAARQFVSGALTVNASLPESASRIDVLPILTELLRQPNTEGDPLLPFVTWMASEPGVVGNSEKWFAWMQTAADPANKGNLQMALKIMRRVCDARDPQLLQAAVKALEKLEGKNPILAAALDGLIEGQKGNAIPPAGSPSALLARLSSSTDPELSQRGQRLGALWGDATATLETIKIIENSKASIDQRIQAIRIARQLKNENVRAALIKLITTEKEESLLTEALRGLSEVGGEGVETVILGKWSNFTTAIRRAAAETLASRTQWSKALVSAVEKKEILPTEIPATVVRSLSQSTDGYIKRRSAELIGRFRETDSDKARLIASKKEIVLNGSVDLKAGYEVAKKACFVCHKLHGEGAEVGPDLTGVGRSSIDALLANIIDPNQIIGKGYENVVVETKDGRTVSGRLVEENESRIRLLATGPKEEIIGKSEIASKQISEMSVMPENLEQMPDQDFRNLVWYIFNPPQDRKPLTVVRSQKNLVLKAQVPGSSSPVDLVTYVTEANLRPYLHPVKDPSGQVVLTEDRPPDHLWQHGIFTGLHQVNGVDFWTEKEGRQRFVKLLDVQQELDRASWRSLTEWVTPGGEVLLEEEQGVTVYPVTSEDFYVADFEWLLRARQKGIKIGKHDYGGFSVRMRTDPKRTHLNSNGEKNEQTANKNAAWVNVARPFGINIFGIAVLDHSDNPGYPSRWRVDDQGLINPSPSLQGDWSIEPQKEKVFHYRLIVHRGSGVAEQIALEHKRFSTLRHRTAQVETDSPVDWESVALWNPLWRVQAPNFEGTPAKLVDFEGRKNVLMTHPFDREKAAGLERQLNLPAGEKSFLHFFVAAHEKGNWELRVKVNDQEVHKQLVDRKGSAWQEVNVDLSGFAGKNVALRLENAANDWSYEFGYWSDLELRPTQLRAKAQ